MKLIVLVGRIYLLVSIGLLFALIGISSLKNQSREGQPAVPKSGNPVQGNPQKSEKQKEKPQGRVRGGQIILASFRRESCHE